MARVDQRLGTAVSTSLEITPFKGTTVAKLKNKYEKLEHDGLLNDKLSKDDIRDHAFRTKFQMDINLVSSETVETLFRYLGMEPGDVSQFDIDRIMNSQRKENTGVQPTLKVKRSKLAQSKSQVTYFCCSIRTYLRRRQELVFRSAQS